MGTGRFFAWLFAGTVIMVTTTAVVAYYVAKMILATARLLANLIVLAFDKNRA